MYVTNLKNNSVFKGWKNSIDSILPFKEKKQKSIDPSNGIPRVFFLILTFAAFYLLIFFFQKISFEINIK